MLEYGTVTKGYRLCDVEHKKILHSPDVQFNKAFKEPEQGSQDEDYTL